MSYEYACWRCGKVLKDLILPLSRREECAKCGADIHICKMCKHYNKDRAQFCSEERAEPPADVEKANFCDYFELLPNNPSKLRGDALDELAQLFGDNPESIGQYAQHDSTSSEDAMKKLNDLFKDN